MMNMFGNSGDYSNWADMPENMQRMMQNYYGGMVNDSSWYGLAHLITWVLIIALLVALVRYFWMLGDKKGGR